jgi:sugar/nucleoside kinase (ribokinase family)
VSEILVVGSLAYDSITTPRGQQEKCLGGSANYFSVVASRYTKVNIVGVVGEDYEDSSIEMLRSRGVDVSGIEKKKGHTFHWEGKYQDDMNEAQTLATHLNVFESFDPKVPEKFKNSPVVFLANIDPELQLKVLAQATNPKIVAVDTMNFWIQTKLEDLKKVLKKANILFVNNTEALMLTRKTNTMNAAKTLSEMGPQIVVIKRGEYGSILYYQNQFFVLPAYPLLEISDPTGAGDTFAGGFMGYLAKNNLDLTWPNLRRACVEGSLVASYTVEDFGLNRVLKLNDSDIKSRFESFVKVVQI